MPIGNIQLGFHPKPVYSPQQTSWATNQAVADNTPDHLFAQKKFMGRGQSLGAGTLAGAMPGMAKQLTTGLLSQSAIPMEDYAANERSQFTGEVNQSGAANRSGALLNALQGTNNNYDLGTRNNQLSQQALLVSLISGLMGSG